MLSPPPKSGGLFLHFAKKRNKYRKEDIMSEKIIVVSTKTYPMTDADKERFEQNIQMERIKHDRDAKCGGVDESGRYRALHRRWEE